MSEYETKVRAIFTALVNGTTEYTPADLEAAASEWWQAAVRYGADRQAARAESMIWNAVAMGSRR